MLSIETVPTSGPAAAADEHLGVVGEGAADAVAVAERDHPDPGVDRRLPPAPVAGAGAGREALDVGDVGAQRERRPQALLGRIALEGIEAVDGDAAAGHVVVGAAVAQDGGAVGGVDERRSGYSALTAVGDLVEAVELLVEEVGVGFVGGGEVGPDAGQLEVGVGGAGAGERQHLRRLAVAEPAHAAVVLDVDAGPAPVGAGPIGDAGGGSPRARRRAPSRPRSATSTSSAVSAPIVSSGTCWKRRPICSASHRGRHREPGRAARRARRRRSRRRRARSRRP